MLSARRVRAQHLPVSDKGSHIHLVLPDAAERAACFRALAAGTARVVRGFASGDAWLEAGDDGTCAILLFRWRQPGAASGAALLDRIAARPGVIAFVAADRLSVMESRTILHAGARDLLPAPLDPRRVRQAVDAALAERRERDNIIARQREAEVRLATLTPRERVILENIAAGLGNKAIARQLELSPRTVEVHRANIMRRAGAGNVAELLRLHFIAGALDGGAADPVHSGA